MAHLIVGLTLIVLGAWVLMYFGIRWQNRPEPEEPTEHGDGEDSDVPPPDHVRGNRLGGPR